MKPWVKRTVGAVCVILVAAVVTAGWYLSNTLPVGTGHVAKTICSNVFIAKRNPEAVFREDIAPVHFLFAITKFDVNKTEKSVASTSYGFFETKAIFREGCGCTVLKGTAEEELRRQTFMNVHRSRRTRRGKRICFGRQVIGCHGYHYPTVSMATS